jgi:hypothetical protein
LKVCGHGSGFTSSRGERTTTPRQAKCVFSADGKVAFAVWLFVDERTDHRGLRREVREKERE